MCCWFMVCDMALVLRVMVFYSVITAKWKANLTLEQRDITLVHDDLRTCFLFLRS